MEGKLIVLRKERGITQKEMADLIGISDITYRTRENGKTQFRANEMKMIADYLNVSVTDLFFNNNLHETKSY